MKNELKEEYEYECVRCGATVKADNKFCPTCGDDLGEEPVRDSSMTKEKNYSHSSSKALTPMSLKSSFIATVKSLFGLKSWYKKMGDKIGVYDSHLFNMIAESIQETGKSCYLVVLKDLSFQAASKWWDIGGGFYAVRYPRICPCCGGAANTSLPFRWAWKKGSTVEELRSDIPYCKGCVKHKKIYERLYTPFSILFNCCLVALGIGFVAYFVDSDTFTIAIICLLTASLLMILAVYFHRVAKRRESNWSMGKCYAKSAAFKFWFDPRKTSRMQIHIFSNPNYAYEFARMNEDLVGTLTIVELRCEDIMA